MPEGADIKRVLLLALYGLSMIWSPVFGTTEAVTFPALAPYSLELLVSRVLNLLAFALVMAVVGLSAERARAALADRRVVVAGVAVGVAGMVIGALAGTQVVPMQWLYAGACLRGLFSGMITVLWVDVLVRQNEATIGVAVAGSLALYAVSGLAIVLVAAAFPAVGLVLLAVCPILTCLGCMVARGTSCHASEPEGGRALVPARTRATIYVANAVFGVMMGVLLYHFARYDTPQGIAAFFLASVVMMGVYSSPLGGRGLRGVFRLLMVCLSVLVLALVLAGGLAGDAAVVLASAALAVILMYTVVIFADTQARLSNPYWRVPGIGQVFAAIGMALASAVVFTVYPDGGIPPSFLVAIACACIVFMAALFSPSERIEVRPWGFSGLAPEESPEIKMMRRCSQLADEHNLTSRELEILQQLVAGSTREQIAEAFVISPATVKTHIRNIYTKLDVHSGKELENLVNG